MAPTGIGREIRRAVPVEATTLLVGWTDLGHGRSMSFLESAEQVAWDVAGGFPYTAATKSGDTIPVTTEDGLLYLADAKLVDVDLVDTTVAGSEWVTQRSDDDLIA